jgi:hypothetical protein
MNYVKHNSKHYRHISQVHQYSCGVASIRMAGLYMNGQDPGGVVVKRVINAAEDAAAGQSQGHLINNVGPHNFDTSGISINTTVKALNSLWPRKKWTHSAGDAGLGVLRNAKPSNPMLVAFKLRSTLTYDTRGKHLVVAVETYDTPEADRMDEDERTVVLLDPAKKQNAGTMDTYLGMYTSSTYITGSAVAVIHATT